MRAKAICVIFCLAMLITLPGCGLIKGVTPRTLMLDALTSEEHKSNLDMTKKIVNALSEKDSSALKSLFSSKTQNLKDIDKQIQAGLDFLKGKVTSYKEADGSETDHTENGEKTSLGRTWFVNDIVTDTGDSYELYIYHCVINKDDKSKEGLMQIDITDKDGKKQVIGDRLA